MKLSASIQKILPFGYLFLVVIGILKESVFFYQIGINILKYSTIMDILISPIATLTAHPIVFIAVTLMVVSLYALPAYLSKKRNKKWAQKMSSLQNPEQLTNEQIENHFAKFFISISTVALLSFFLGIGIGEGAKLNKKIKTDKLEYNHKLNFGSGESEEVYLINTNSVYYFYLTKGNKAVKIAPIGAVKSIEFTNNKMLK